MILTADIPGERLDAFLARACPDLTRSAAQKLIEGGNVLRCGRPGKKNDKLNVGDEKIPALFSRDGVYYFPRSYSYDLYEDEMEVDLISIPNVNVEVEIK